MRKRYFRVDLGEDQEADSGEGERDKLEVWAEWKRTSVDGFLHLRGCEVLPVQKRESEDHKLDL